MANESTELVSRLGHPNRIISRDLDKLQVTLPTILTLKIQSRLNFWRFLETSEIFSHHVVVPDGTQQVLPRPQSHQWLRGFLEI